MNEDFIRFVSLFLFTYFTLKLWAFIFQFKKSNFGIYYNATLGLMYLVSILSFAYLFMSSVGSDKVSYVVLGTIFILSMAINSMDFLITIAIKNKKASLHTLDSNPSVKLYVYALLITLTFYVFEFFGLISMASKELNQ